jgi:hypothetical protein
MFLTQITRTFYKTIWSRYPTVVNIDHDTRMTWTNSILWLSKEGKQDVPVYYKTADDIDKEVNHIITVFNENEKEDNATRMVAYLEMRDAERHKN